MTANATLKLSLRARRTNLGDDRSAYPKSGFAMAIPIVLMELMRTQLCTIVQHHSHVLMTNSLARTDVASTKDGLAITITIVATARMKENSVTLNTKHARRKSSLVRTSNASGINTDAVRLKL